MTISLTAPFQGQTPGNAQYRWSFDGFDCLAHELQPEPHALAFEGRPWFEAKASRAAANSVVSGENRHLRVVGIGQEALISGRSSVPATPFPGVAHTVLKAAEGEGSHHRPEDSFRLSQIGRASCRERV